MTDHSNEDKGISFKERILKDLEKNRMEAAQKEGLEVEEGSVVNIKPSFHTEEQQSPVETQPEPDQELVREQTIRSAQAQPVADQVSEIVTELQAEQTAKDEGSSQSEDPFAPERASVSEEPVVAASRSAVDRSRKSKKRVSKKKRKASLASRIALTVSLLFVLTVLAVGVGGYFYIHSALQPVDASSKQFVSVEIPAGSSNKQIATILEKKGVIKSGQVFNYYVKFKNMGNFQSGYYNLQKSMDLETIAAKLTEGGTEEPQEPVVGSVTIPEGYTLSQIADVIRVNAASKKKEETPFKKDDFLKVVQDEAFIKKMADKYPKLLASLPKKEDGVKYRLEGYLFPATYNYGEKTSVEDLIDQMLGAMDKNLTAYYDAIAAKNLTVNEVLTLASLVEKEGSTDQDRKNIASTFFNRLNQNMPLQSNIAILYAMDKLGQKTTLAEDAAIDTNIDSKYNIYKNPGLMPGPVDNAGLKAIDAVVNPNKTDYLYFVANVEDGTVYFAKTYEEHEKNVNEHVNSKLQTTPASSSAASQ